MNVKRILPIAGIVAFSLCSTYSLYHLLAVYARDDTLLFWLPSVAIELFTAWAVYNVVEQARKVTQSNISKQDRRFYGLVLALFLAVAIPTLAASIVANTLKFSGNILLGLLFPVASIGCAVGVALPDTIGRYEHHKETDRQQAEMDRKARRQEKESRRQQMELERQQAEMQAETRRKQEEMEAEIERQQAETERKQAEARRQFRAGLGAAGQTLALYEANPNATQAEIAALANVSERTIRNHLTLLKSAGLLESDNGGIKIKEAKP